MGVQPHEMKWAGHWCAYDLVSNIDIDCQRRMERIKYNHSTTITSKTYKPLQLFVPVGGAGALRSFILNFVQAFAPYVQDGNVQLFLNAGDHKHKKVAFLQLLDECGLDFETVSDTKGVREFQTRLLSAVTEPMENVTLFAFEEYFPAAATTDLLRRVCDVLCCKPSGLAFYCVPKLYIRRVGDHEADSAKCSSELGDETLEAWEITDAIRYIQLFLHSPDLVLSMNETIMNNNKIDIYSGCKRAVELALERHGQQKKNKKKNKNNQKHHYKQEQNINNQNYTEYSLVLLHMKLHCIFLLMSLRSD